MAEFESGKLAEAVATQEELVTLLDGEDWADVKLDDAEAALQRYRQALASKRDD